MSDCFFTALGWLPEAPDDFRARVKAADIDGAGLRQLAGYRLNTNQLMILNKAMQKLKAEGKDLKPAIPFKLGVVGNITTELFTPALQATALRHGIDLDLYEAPFDTMAQEALGPRSGLNQAECDAIFFAIDYRNLPFALSPGNAEAAKSAVDEVLAYILQLRDGVKQHRPVTCIFQTLVPPTERLFGGFERHATGTARDLVDTFNRKLIEAAAQSGDIVFDVTPLAETVGLAQWNDPAGWHMAKLPFAQNLVPLYADHLARLVATLRGKARKVLVLDLDNTLWGGVIGDDGMAGIKIGQGSPAGEAFLAIQKTALHLRDRGVVLAVCSKNNDDVARQPFRAHPDMLLKEDHISVFQANWVDKASNLQAIAKHLSLGTDAMVFLDDNPAERARVRQMLPEVAVPELPADPAFYPRALMAGGYFETVSFSDEDKKRAEFYQKNAQRVTLQSKLGDYEGYLASLEMVMHVSPFDELGRARIAQLINKSNQFNLTTRRYTEAQVRDLELDPAVFTLQARLSDKFGDNGMINVVVCRRTSPDAWDIDSWLMSCRVLERRVEEATLAEIVHHARKEGVTALTASYIPTDRNALVKDHYLKLGFEKTGEDVNGMTQWRLNLPDYAPAALPIQITRAA